MGKESFHFRLGAFKCTIVNDGDSPYSVPAKVFFVNAPDEQLKKVIGDHDLDISKWEKYFTPLPSLLIDTGQHRVLVDTGEGNLEPTTGKLIPNLRAEGIAPEDIDTVILTHGHADHIGGNVTSEGKPAFPNARYVMSKDEWDFWISKPDLTSSGMSETEKELTVKCVRDSLLPIRDQLELVDREAEIIPGVWAVMAPGHTAGHIAVSVVSENRHLLCISDTAIHQIHVEQPHWYIKYDMAPEQAVATRRWLLARAAAEEALVHAYHFPFPGLGYVTQKGVGWQWQPMRQVR